MEFKNLKFNQDVPDDKFIFKPPAGTQVVDITPMATARVGGQKEEDVQPKATNSPPASSSEPLPSTK
jgi:hypothetical protein